MTKFDGIIFDIDGTMTSTNELIFASFNHIMNKYLNKTLTNNEIISLFGPPEDVILEECTGENYPAARKDYYDFYADNHEMADLYPGIYEILDFIKSKNIPLAIFTGKGKEAAKITLKKLKIYDFFDLIITGDDVKEHKPSPEGILKFVGKFNLTPQRILMIGDSPSDIKAARGAEVKIASVLWDSYSKEKVIELKSDYVFHTVGELRNFLKTSL
ncbi:MAG: HAD-IA family hydrolase [Ignavibacteriaceae bacterium]